jgi:hypothetical protein
MPDFEFQSCRWAAAIYRDDKKNGTMGRLSPAIQEAAQNTIRPNHDSAVFIERRNLASAPRPASTTQASLDRHGVHFVVIAGPSKWDFMTLLGSAL